MSEIQRYDIDHFPSDDGPNCKFSDHEAAVAEKDARIAELEARCAVAERYLRRMAGPLTDLHDLRDVMAFAKTLPSSPEETND